MNLYKDLIIKETLELLEWPRFCLHVSKFSSTPQGRRYAKALPLPDKIEISRLRLKETEEIRDLDCLIEGGVSFQGVHDIGNIVSRCSKGGIASAEELLAIAETLSSARRLRRQLYDPEIRPVISSHLKEISTLPDLEKLLKYGLEESGRIADRASKNLTNLRLQLRTLRTQRNDVLQELLRRYNSILHENVIAERFGRPVLAVKAGSASYLQGIVHDTSASGSTTFVEPHSVVVLGNRIVEMDSKINTEKQRLLKSWSSVVGKNSDVIDQLCAAMLMIDVALSRARYCNWLGGVAPNLLEDKNAPFVFEKLRHPLLLWQEKFEHGDPVVPLNIEVSSSIKVVAITGPNTGGKTVTLKSIGLVTLMAKAGFLLPCSGTPSLPWCSNIFADIGDEQSLEQNLSTFSGHVKRIGRILEALSVISGPVLILLDEVGAGTDPSEGTALAKALLLVLADRARLTIATTHFGELKALKYRDSRFENASVAFNSETMSPTYFLQWGIPGRSNAIAIAQRLGLDLQVIDIAKGFMSPKGEGEVNSIISGLEEQRRRQQSAAEEAAVLLAKAELLHDELLSGWEKQRQKSAEIQQKGRFQLEASIREGQKEVRDLIRRLRQEGADGETARRAGQRLRRIEAIQSHQKHRSDQKDWIPEVGERIRVIPFGKSCEILSISENGKQLTVRCGVMRSTVDIFNVEALDGRRATELSTVVRVDSENKLVNSPSVRMKSNTLDVRGLRVDEAEIVIEDYLRRKNGSIWIIHGIGTGKLKQGIRKWLVTLPYVDDFYDADQADGGSGCTVIKLIQ